MKRKVIDWLFVLTAITAMLAVSAICSVALKEQRSELTVLKTEHAKLQETLQACNDHQTHLATAQAETNAALQQTRTEAGRLEILTQELARRSQTAAYLAGLLECEVDRLRPLRKVTTIIVHHSESVFGDVPTIDAWHRERGFSQVGYHYVICNGNGGGEDGEIQFARDEDVQGAHAKANYRNVGTIGVCLIGTTAFTQAQQRSLQLLLQHLCRRHGLKPGPDTIQTHHERCPGDGLDLNAFVATISR